jgi:hypothetical protein
MKRGRTGRKDTEVMAEMAQALADWIEMANPRTSSDKPS